MGEGSAAKTHAVQRNKLNVLNKGDPEDAAWVKHL